MHETRNDQYNKHFVRVSKFYFYQFISLFSKIAVKPNSLEDRRHMSVAKVFSCFARVWTESSIDHMLIIISIKCELER